MIEKVGYTRPVAAARALRKAGKADATGFAEALAAAEGIGGVEGVEATGAVGNVAAMGALLGAQEVDPREEKRRKAVRRGQMTLDVLENLRHALLLGTLPLTTLTRLEQLVAEERTATDDPALLQILDEIALRAAVELAKLEMSGIFFPPADHG